MCTKIFASRWLPGNVAAVSIVLWVSATAASAALSNLPNPVPLDSAQVRLVGIEAGDLVMSWVTRKPNGHELQFARWDGRHWSAPVAVAQGADWFVNWADFPSVMPLQKGLWAAHWLVKRPGSTYSYDIAIALSRDQGNSWGAPFTPHTDGTATEHGFVSMLPFKQALMAIWLDGRNTAGGEGHGGGMTLRMSHIDARGATVAAVELDGLVCDCCQTDAAVSGTGLVVAYRDRSEQEIRDISVVRYNDGAWTKPSPVARDGWEISGCPVNGPAVAALGRQVGVAWYTAADDVAKVRVAYSDDNGATFLEPVDVDDNEPVGRVDIVFVDEKRLLISWMAADEQGRAALMARTLDVESMRLGTAKRIASMSGGRPTGFPQLAKYADGVVFAWSTLENDQRTVKTAVWSLPLETPLGVDDGIGN